MNNLGLIIGALFLAPRYGVYGLAIGAVIGAGLHLGVQLPVLRLIDSRLHPALDWRTPGVTEVLRLMGPRIIGSAVVQINFVVNAALTSGMTAGSLSALTLAFGLMFTVLGVLGQSVGTAVFPTLSLLSGRGDDEGFRRTLTGALRGVLFTSIPATVGLIVLANPLVATIYQHNRWTPEATVATAWALQFFSLGLAAFALQEVLARAFFALHDTLTPVMIAVGGMLLNVALSLILIRVIHGQEYSFGTPANPLTALALWNIPAGQGPFGGLALANALATMVESAALWWFIRHKAGGLDNRAVLEASVRVLVAALIMGVVVVGVMQLIGSRSALIVLLAGTLAGGITFEIVALLLGLPEARSVPAALLRRFKR